MVARLKACGYCGRIHAADFDCGRQPKKVYRRGAAEAGRYTRGWREKALEVKERCHFLCEYCRAQGSLTYAALEVHHITRLQDRPDLLLEDGNLICLCRRHHEMAERGEIDAATLRALAARRDT